MPQRTAYFLPQGQRGGCGIKKRGGVAAPHSLNSFVFCGLPLLFGFHNDDTGKSGKTIATPPKRGVPTGPDSGPLEHARYPASGGRYRRYLSLREGSEQPPGGALKEGARTYEMAVAPMAHSTFNRETNWRIITS